MRTSDYSDSFIRVCMRDVIILFSSFLLSLFPWPIIIIITRLLSLYLFISYAKEISFTKIIQLHYDLCGLCCYSHALEPKELLTFSKNLRGINQG